MYEYYEGIQNLRAGEIFVYGSNYRGVPGAGAAKTARTYYGAQYGISEGFTGRCYAIPTKDLDIKTLPLETIKKHVERFIDYTHIKCHLNFLVTPIGTGLAGYEPGDIAPMFILANKNCRFDIEWKPFLENAHYTARYE